MESSKDGMSEKDSSPCANCMLKTSNAICDCHRDRISEQHICDKCVKVFPNKEALMLHKWVHKWEEKNCDQKELTTKGKVKSKTNKSMVVLDGSVTKLWYFCPSCNMKFSTKSELSKHKYIHTGKEFECEVCGHLSSVKKKLKLHLSTHQEKTRFCSVCGKTFTRSEFLARHMKAVHLNLALHKCEICSKTFRTKSSLNLHKKLHYRDELLFCTVCNKGFQTKAILKAHSLKHIQSILSQKVKYVDG